MRAEKCAVRKRQSLLHVGSYERRTLVRSLSQSRVLRPCSRVSARRWRTRVAGVICTTSQIDPGVGGKEKQTRPSSAARKPDSVATLCA